jgi:replicative DNA helicase Mcm
MSETSVFEVVVLAAAAAFYGRDWLRERFGRDGDPVEEAHELYRNDEIDEAELGRRLELALDPEADRIRAAGLTAAIVKDSFSSEQFSIEAGTLVRANKGIAIVDELDKGKTSDLDSLHTALESQEVHVSKAGKNAMLPAKTALLAAGNPTGGHFDPTEEFAEQIELKSPLLSRFDLIFAMREAFDEEMVHAIATKVVEARNVAGKLAHGEEVDAEVLDRVCADISKEEFRAYVTHSKRIEPVIRDPKVERELARWFTDLKGSLPNRYQDAMKQAEDDDLAYDGPPLPITVRKLNAMQRLTEASARMRLSPTVEMEDVERVRPLIERSLGDIGIAPRDSAAFGRVDESVTAESIGLGD